jgi:hypothetical protein
MRRRHVTTRLSLSIAAFALALPLAASAAVYTTLASFLAVDPNATLSANFESQPLGAVLPFTEGGLSFYNSINGLYVIGPSLPGTTLPLPPSHMLTCSGQDDIMIGLPDWTPAVGFTLLTNSFGPGTVTLIGPDLNTVLTYQPTQAPNTIGFLGFVLPGARISWVHWVADHGGDQNTALDDIYVDKVAVTPVRSSSWGRLKVLYQR